MAYFEYYKKRCYYNEIGVKEGIPLLLLHGNTASSNMFSSVIEYYRQEYKLVLIDFLGHGKSERLEKFPVDLWFEEAKQVIYFLDKMNYKKVFIIGSSGGALVAFNVALERPDLVEKVIADSFEGEVPLADFIKNIKTDRELSKNIEEVKAFYEYNHGQDWENVVDNDTNALFEHNKTIGKFFHKPLESLEIPVLLTGSREDEFVNEAFYTENYTRLLKKIKKGSMYLFEKGGHPAILSNGLEFSKAAKKFLKG